MLNSPKISFESVKDTLGLTYDWKWLLIETNLDVLSVIKVL